MNPVIISLMNPIISNEPYYNYINESIYDSTNEATRNYDFANEPFWNYYDFANEPYPILLWFP